MTALHCGLLAMHTVKKLRNVQKNKESCTFLSFLTDFIIRFLLDFLYARVRKYLFCCSANALSISGHDQSSTVNMDKLIAYY